MLAKDKMRTTVIKSLISDMTYAEKEKSAKIVDAYAILSKSIKRREESFSLYKQGNRDDLANVEKSELEILKNYMPEAMSVSEIEDLVSSVIVDISAGPKDVGKVIKAVGEKMDSVRAPRKAVSEAAKRLLSQL